MAFFSKTLDKLKGALKKTVQVLNTDVRTLFIPGRQIDDETTSVPPGELIELARQVSQVQLVAKLSAFEFSNGLVCEREEVAAK